MRETGLENQTNLVNPPGNRASGTAYDRTTPALVTATVPTAGEYTRDGGREARHDAYVSFALRNRSALVTTDTELSAIAAPAITGESKMPNAG